MKCVKNFMSGWTGDSLKPLTEKSLNKLRGTWAEVLNADDYIKPLFDIDLKVPGKKEEQVDYLARAHACHCAPDGHSSVPYPPSPPL